MYTINELRKLRKTAKFYGLSASNRFWFMPYKRMQKVCNGCGPQAWDDNKRKALTSALKRYEPCFAIHDDRYQKPHSITQQMADRQLKQNMIKVWRKDFGFWRWLSHAGRIERLVIIPTIYSAVVLGGSDAYNA